MTISLAFERLHNPSIEAWHVKHSKLVEKLTAFVTPRTISIDTTGMSTTSEIKALDDIELIHELPDEEIDRRLALSAAIADKWREDTGDIPAIIVDTVRADAATIIETWEVKDYTTQAIRSLGEAYDIVHEHMLLEKALDVVHETPQVVALWPSLTTALEQAANTNNGFQESLAKLDSGRLEIVEPAPTQDVSMPPIQPRSYDWLYNTNG